MTATMERSALDTSIADWLISEGPICGSLAEMVEGFCRKLREAGIPIDRATMGAPLLHPIAQSSYVAWDVEKGSEQRWFYWTPQQMEVMRASPIYVVYTQGRDVLLDLAQASDRERFPIGADLWKERYQCYHALALRFSDGSHKVFTAASKSEGGFSDRQFATIKNLMPLLSVVYEGFIARNTAITLMETYVGKRAGLRVLDGQITKGDGSHIEAVIWFSDMRRFTELSSELNDRDMLELLNEYLETITASIEENGGEVLKYIGDAVLAIFPFESSIEAAVANAESAALAALEARREANSRFDFGVALHLGEVFYGNVGGGTRLDFTVIGEAVNQASRIEGLCNLLGERFLVSRQVASHSKRKWSSAGQHQLKGIRAPVEVFVTSDA